MGRLIALTFAGSYRGPAWSFEASAPAAREAAVHGAAHPRDPHAHGQAHRGGHEVAHGAADVVAVHAPVWHGPHEAPRAMTWPLLVLAAGAVIAGFAGVPAALGGSNAIEHFLAPSFAAPVGEASMNPAAAAHDPDVPHLSPAGELGLMFVSVLVAMAGLLAARHIYLARPDLAARLASRWWRTYRVLWNKYYVDEIYGATWVKGTWASASGLWRFDRAVVDGAVDASGWITRLAAWVSHMIDKYVVDGLVNLVAASAGGWSHVLRRLQTGLVQNYALMMVFGVFALLTIYLLG